jgi:uncharacterized protein
MHNGDVYACDHYVDRAHWLGNLGGADFVDLLRSPGQVAFGQAKRTELPPSCLSCPVRWACHGGCPKDRFVVNTDDAGDSDDAGPLTNYLCAGYRAFFAHAGPAAIAIAGLLREGCPAAGIMHRTADAISAPG